MRLKRYPSDFRVRELVDLPRDVRTAGGPFFVHRVRKEKLDTLEAIARVAALAGVDRAAIAFAGLKDRQGVTEQWITIEGARVDHRERGLEVRFVGRSDRPMTSKQSRGNAFEVVVRELAGGEVDGLAETVAELERSGFPNYFDDQRFDCLRHGQGFVMKAVLGGRFETALHALIAQPSPVARSGDVRLKTLLDRYWGDWERCADIARGPVWRRLFDQLQSAPQDFRAALATLPSRTTLIHAFAYQSFLWNRALSLRLEKLVAARDSLALRTLAGRVLGWARLAPELVDVLRAEDTPLFGPGGAGGGPAFAAATREVLREAGLTEADFEQTPIPGMILREEPRAAWLRPRTFRFDAPERDETTPGRYKVRVQFELPRGAYATMLIKRLWAAPWRQSELRSERAEST